MVWAVPLSTTELSPRRLTPVLRSRGIRGLIGFGKRLAPSPSQGPTPAGDRTRLHPNAFRGEPAISGFDWHFTPTHSSSNRFATRESTGLHALLRALHPGHG